MSTLKRLASGTWEPAQGYVSPIATTAAPPSPAVDQLWYDNTAEAWKRWTGSAWVADGISLYQPLGATAPAGKLPTRRAVTMIANFGLSGITGWSGSSGAASSTLNDTTNFARGDRSAQFVSKADGSVAALRSTTIPTLDLTGKKLEISIRVSAMTHLRTLLVYLGDTSFASFYVWTLYDSVQTAVKPGDDGEWMTFTVDPASLTSTTGTPNLAAITSMQVAAQDDSGGAVTVNINHIGYFTSPAAVSYLSLGFDDSFLSHKTICAPKLEQYNYQGTFYTIVDRIGLDAYCMTLAQLLAMQEIGGHEIAAHAFTAAGHNTVGGYPGLSATALDAELRGLKGWLTQYGFRGRDHFAYPQGFYSAASEQIIRRYFSSARTTQRFPFETFPPANYTRLRTNTCNTPQTLAQAKAKVDLVAATPGSWGVLTFHDIVASPPTPPGTAYVQWDTASFNSLIDYIATKTVTVRTVGDVLAA